MIPYKNYTNKELKDLIEIQYKHTSAPKYIQTLIDISFDDNWNPVNDFDGCTAVQDFNHPDLSCYIHDWLWRTGKGGKFSNKLFYKIMHWEGVSTYKARCRYIGVSLAWELWFKFKRRKQSFISLQKVKDICNLN